MAANDKQKKQRSCLYDLGWIRQKSDWLNALRQFAGQSWIDVSTMNSKLLDQIKSGSAFQMKDGSPASSKETAEVIKLKTGIFSDPQLTGDQAREVIIGFHRNQYDMWVGIDFTFGEVGNARSLEGVRTREPLFRDVFFEGQIHSVLPRLADIAVAESWRNDEGETGLLVPYLKHTYERLVDDGKSVVSRDGKLMMFNTGLVSRESFDPIFAICDKNDRPSPEWKFRDFLAWNKENGLEIFRKFEVLPSRVDWFLGAQSIAINPTDIKRDEKNASDIDLSTIGEALKRSIPLPLLLKIANRKSTILKEVQRLCDMWKNMKEDSEEENSIEMRKKKYLEILNELGGVHMASDEALGIVRKSLSVTIKLLAWEVNTAVPMYVTSKSNKGFNLMLPLDFECANPEDADMAVVLEPVSTSEERICYMPKSLLELKYAYSNARLLSRPTTPWIVNGYRKYLKTLLPNGKAF